MIRMPLPHLAFTVTVAVILTAGSAAAQQQQAPTLRPPAAAPAGVPLARQLPPKGTGIVFIDQGEIQNEAAAFKGLGQQQTKLANALQTEITKMENDLRTADEELNKQRTVLSPDAYTQKRRDLDKRFQDAQQRVQNRKRDIDTSIGDAYNKVMQQVLEIVGEIVRENDYKVVFERKFLVAAETSLDISGEVVNRLNKKMPTVAVVAPK